MCNNSTKRDKVLESSIERAIRDMEKKSETIKMAGMILYYCKKRTEMTLVVEDYFDYSEEWREYQIKSKKADERLQYQREVKAKMYVDMSNKVGETLEYINEILPEYKLELGVAEVKQGTVGRHFKYAFAFSVKVKKVE